MLIDSGSITLLGYLLFAVIYIVTLIQGTREISQSVNLVVSFVLANLLAVLMVLVAVLFLVYPVAIIPTNIIIGLAFLLKMRYNHT